MAASQRLTAVITTLLAAAVPFAAGLLVYRQGFNFIDDGLWLLGGKILADGGALYRDLFSIYGPARYLLLLPCFLVTGQSALALVLLKAATDAAAAALGFVHARSNGAGRLAWLVPLAVLALGPMQPRYLAVGALALGLAAPGPGSFSRRRLLGIGAAWGGVCLFGVDAAAYGGLVVLAGILAREPRRCWLPALTRTAGGLLAVLAVFVLYLAATGALTAARWDLVTYPLTRFGQAMHVSWFKVFADTEALGRPFQPVMTGEALPAAWPGHAVTRAFAMRLLYVGAWLLPALAVWVGWRSGARTRFAPLAALGAAGWIALSGRGDQAHLQVVWLASLWLLPLLLAAAGRRVVKATLVALAVAALLPLLGEKVWLASHAGRGSLARWQRPTAGILLQPETIATIEAVFAGIPGDPDAPLLIWPNHPGLYFLCGVPLPTPQATLLAGEVRDEAGLVARLAESPPRAVIHGRSWGVVAGATSLRDLVPEVWAFLRQRYYVADVQAGGGEQFRVYLRDGTGGRRLAQLPLQYHLPDVDQVITTGLGPVMTPDVTVGQSFVTDRAGFKAISLRWSNPGPRAVEVPLEIAVSAGGLGDTWQPARRFQVAISLAPGRSWVLLEPPAGTAGDSRRIRFTVRVTAPTAYPVQLCLSLPGKDGAQADVYPGGTAWIDGRPVRPDLSFQTY